jgi:hypothetical protein
MIIFISNQGWSPLDPDRKHSIINDAVLGGVNVETDLTATTSGTVPAP